MWLGREDSNLRMAESKSAALPLGYAPKDRRGRTIPSRASPINGHAIRGVLEAQSRLADTPPDDHSP